MQPIALQVTWPPFDVNLPNSLPGGQQHIIANA